MADLTPAKRLFDLLITRDFEVETLDSSGKANPDPTDAEIFSFDFTTTSGNNYGTVVIMLGDDNSLTLFTSDNVGRTMEGPDKEEWFAFQEQLKNFSTRNNFMHFDIKNINKLKYSMQGQAAIKEGLFESWTGNKHTSWNDKPEHVRLMIKHKKPLGETDARYRYIESLFVETSDGERFKLPFTKLSGGRAMCEHVRAGGKPYDARGVHIASIVEELNVLSRFRRANHGKVFEGDTAELINETNLYYETLHKILKGLGSKRGYTNYFECWNPATITEQELVVESIKNMFVRQSLDERIEEALPILARIQQQGRAMKEANIFESWANRLMEGTWATPETPEQKEKLVTMLSQELPVGADATNATEQLYDVLGDDVLFDQLESLADQDANADARQTIINRMQELADDPNVAEVIAQLNVDVDTPTEVDVDAEISADETGIEQDVEEGTFRDEDGSADEDDLDEQGVPGNLPPSQVPGKEKLLKTPASDTERALAKIKDFVRGVRGSKDVETFGSLKEEDLEEWATGAAIGGALGAAVGGPVGASIGSAVGSDIQDKLAKEIDEDDDIPTYGPGPHGSKGPAVGLPWFAPNPPAGSVNGEVVKDPMPGTPKPNWPGAEAGNPPPLPKDMGKAQVVSPAKIGGGPTGGGGADTPFKAKGNPYREGDEGLSRLKTLSGIIIK